MNFPEISLTVHAMGFYSGAPTDERPLLRRPANPQKKARPAAIGLAAGATSEETALIDRWIDDLPVEEPASSEAASDSGEELAGLI